MKKYTPRQYRHIYGIGYQFIKPQGRNQWYPINEDRWELPPGEPFFFTDETLFLPLQARLNVQMKLASDNAEARLQKALREDALREIARNLKASLDEEKLAQAIDFFSRQDEWFE